MTSRAGDILLVPVALAAFWTLAYQLVLVTRFPAETIVWFFLPFSALGFYYAGRLWVRTKAVPGTGYSFYASHLLLLVVGIGCGTVVLFVLRPNQDDVVYFHRALTQLSAFSQPILTRQTSVDIDAAAFSPVHLATSHEMLMAFLGHFLRIDPLYFYQVIGHVITAFSIPFVFYWCGRCFGMERWPATCGALCAVVFLLIDSPGLTSYGNTAFGRMWQGKAIVWILFMPLALSLSYRFLRERNYSDILWLTLLAVSGVGLSNSALYLIPAAIGCACLASLAVHLLEQSSRAAFWLECQWCGLLAIPLAYPVTILMLLKLNVIRQPIDLHGLGPAVIPWWQGIDYVVGRPPELVRDVLLLLVIPLIIIRGRRGLFLFFYACAIWLLCLNPLLAHFWMKNITAACYFRLVFLLPVPLLCVFLPLIVRRWVEIIHDRNEDRVLKVLGVIGMLMACVYSYRSLTIAPKNKELNWKSPLEYQLLRANIQFARAAGQYIAHSKLLAPEWTASCELPLLLPAMKVVAPRLVTHYFANAGNAREGVLRHSAAAFVEGEKTNDPKQMDRFRLTIKSRRANALAVPVAESGRVLAALQSIDPHWHAILEAGGLVLMLRGSTGTTDSLTKSGVDMSLQAIGK